VHKLFPALSLPYFDALRCARIFVRYAGAPRLGRDYRQGQL